MAAAPGRARSDYDYLVKLLLIGDSGNSNFFTLGLSSSYGVKSKTQKPHKLFDLSPDNLLVFAI